MKVPSIFLLICLAFASCESNELSRGGFEPITNSMIRDSITPAVNYDYYEVREVYCWDTTTYRVKTSQGNYPLADSIFCSQGIDYSTGDICSLCNILSFTGLTPTFWTTFEDVIYFLAPIDSYGDALLLAHLKGYTFRMDDVKYGIKEVDKKFYLKAFKMVSMCTPIQTDQFFLEITEAGKINVLDEEVYSKLVSACI
jgi:hypothetical protein